MHHITTGVLGYTINFDTLLFTWSCMVLIIFGALILTANLSEDTAKFGVRQHIAEGVFNFIRTLTTNQIGKRGDHYVFLIGSIFIFILVNYYAGLLPWKMGAVCEWWPHLPAEHGGHAHPWHGASPCADINIPAGIALIVVATYFISGASVAGFKYVQMYLPINFSKKGVTLNPMCLIELMDLIVRPLTLSLRLFANTVAGETLLATFVGLVALILPVAVLGFEMAVGVLQAFLFAILSTVYIGTAVQHAEHLVHDEHH